MREHRRGKIHEKLYKKAKDHQALEQKRRAMEVKYCSFQPNIDKNS
jgi:IS30 family transposase